MAASKSTTAGVRLTSPNGATVVVSKEKAARLTEGHGYTAESKSSGSSSSTPSK